MGLMPQDAYYYLYGQNLSLSYFDHPGMIGYILRDFYRSIWSIYFCNQICRFYNYILNHIKFLQISFLLFIKTETTKSIVLLASTIFISILSFNSTPDVPLLLFWTLSLICLYKAIFEEKKWYWILAELQWD